MPPEADYINDETLKVYEQDNKNDNTNQLIIDNSVTLLLGDY